jgi:N-methylhydantoinase B
VTNDAILTSVIANRMKAIGERMGRVVERSARSQILVEGRDFSLGIYDVDGVLLEQTEYIPILGYATTPGMREIAKAFAGTVQEGDVVLHNDPFTGGNQISDWKVAKPVFHEGEHFGWVVINAHQADVGGAVPGSYNPNATDIWQEGLRITPLKLFEGGARREDVWRLVFGNVRLGVVAEDVTAMIGSCTVGERELKALLARYGLETVRRATASMLDAAETAARAAIARLPDGVYPAEREIHDDGIDHDLTATIRVSVTIAGDRAIFDFSETDEQVAGYVNTPLAVTISAVMIAFFMVVEEELPHNDGIMRCVEVIVPEGRLLNPRFPAPTGFGNHVGDQIASVVLLALAPAAPRQVTACWNPLLASSIAGWSTATQAPYVDILINACKGGGGATFAADGYDHIGLIGSGGAIAAQDPEMFELVNPILLHRFEYVRDSGGAGRWRGGLGVETVVEFEEGGVLASVFGDGNTAEGAAFGIFGGRAGCPNAIELRYPDGHVVHPRLKDLISDIPAGTVYRQIAGGGGGYGDPRERSAEQVRAESEDGLTSIAAARELYGVVVDPETWEIDEEETARRRAG